jgi:hypothetical protein
MSNIAAPLPKTSLIFSIWKSIQVQGSKQMAHSNSFWRSFSRDSRTEENVNIMIIEQKKDPGKWNVLLIVDWLVVQVSGFIILAGTQFERLHNDNVY